MPGLTNGSLPKPASDAVLNGVLRLGYHRSAVLQDYTFSVGEGRVAKADVLAFADPKHRTPADYAAISALHNPEPQDPGSSVETLARSGALFHILHQSGAFQFWISEFDAQRKKPLPRRILDGVAYERLPEALENFGADLSPQRIIGV